MKTAILFSLLLTSSALFSQECKLTLNELKELLVEFPKKETKFLVKKEAVIDYLISKM